MERLCWGIVSGRIIFLNRLDWTIYKFCLIKVRLFRREITCNVRTQHLFYVLIPFVLPRCWFIDVVKISKFYQGLLAICYKTFIINSSVLIKYCLKLYQCDRFKLVFEKLRYSIIRIYLFFHFFSKIRGECFLILALCRGL